MATILPPLAISGIASRTPTRKAFGWESKAESHCSSVICNGGWKNAGTSGRALLTKTSSFLNCSSTLRHISLHDESVGIASADFGKRLVGGTLVLVIVDGDLHSLLRQLQRDSSTDAARASGDQGMFRVAGHMDLLMAQGRHAHAPRNLGRQARSPGAQYLIGAVPSARSGAAAGEASTTASGGRAPASADVRSAQAERPPSGRYSAPAASTYRCGRRAAPLSCRRWADPPVP